MNQYLKSLIAKIRTMLSSRPASMYTELTRTTEKFDVVERVPVYTRIKFLNP